MERLQRIRFLNEILLSELPDYAQQAKQFADTEQEQRRLLRSLMNVRPPMPLRADFLCEQDILLREEVQARGVVHVDGLPTVTGDPRLVLWQGDITRLDADAIVNAANSALLGCFLPCHNCIDNVIHSAAGLQLRDACAALMQAQGHEEPVGHAKLTPAFNLPSRYVLHTVGPCVTGRVTQAQQRELAACYRACLMLAAQHGLRSVAFCCISTGVFHFPNALAARIAVDTVRACLAEKTPVQKVVFNVFRDEDRALYQTLLGLDEKGMAR